MNNKAITVVADENIGYLSRLLARDSGIAVCHMSSSAEYALQVLLNPDNFISSLVDCHSLLICIKISTLLLYTADEEDFSRKIQKCVGIIHRLIGLARSSNTKPPILITRITPLGIGSFSLEQKMSMQEQQVFCDSFNNSLCMLRINDHDIEISDVILAQPINDEKSYKTYLRTKTYTPLSKWQALSDEFIRFIYAVKNSLPKLIFVDLDNTLWEGVISESFQEIRIGGHDPVGEAYMHIQLYLKELSKSGVLLAIVSKNDAALVSEFFEKRSDMPLSLADFVTCEASWDRKSCTIERILKTLRLRAQDCALLDDSVHERAEVAAVFPEIRLLDVPSDIFKRLLFLERALPISRELSTEEDKSRLAFYKQMNRREKDRQYMDLKLHGNQDPQILWLNGLNTWLSLTCITSGTIEKRVSQLYSRTNQFNMTGKHLTPGSIADQLKLGSILITGTVGDKYGNDGIAISAIILEVGTSLVFQEFVMSCRIIGRFVEDAFVISICNKFPGADRLILRFIDSGKNTNFIAFKDRICSIGKNDWKDPAPDIASAKISALESNLQYRHVKVEWN